ncbi:hypothetical protein ACJ67_11730 [Methylophilus sp. TWE2]|nr:hypothetical protein ACJ67_11730 [Methylophilus sp. TWE2]
MSQLRNKSGQTIFGLCTDEAHLRPKDCARLLGVSIATFWRLVSKGQLKTTKLTERTTTVKLNTLREFIANREAA